MVGMSLAILPALPVVPDLLWLCCSTMLAWKLHVHYPVIA